MSPYTGPSYMFCIHSLPCRVICQIIEQAPHRLHCQLGHQVGTGKRYATWLGFNLASVALKIAFYWLPRFYIWHHINGHCYLLPENKCSIQLFHILTCVVYLADVSIWSASHTTHCSSVYDVMLCYAASWIIHHQMSLCCPCVWNINSTIRWHCVMYTWNLCSSIRWLFGIHFREIQNKSGISCIVIYWHKMCHFSCFMDTRTQQPLGCFTPNKK